MNVSPQEVQDAKEAVRAFIHQVFWPNYTIGGEEYEKCYRALVPFANSYIPLSGSSFKQGRDFMAPSFWHICCFELGKWVLSRQANENKEIDTFAYRGQTHSWPIKPSLWRSDIRTIGQKPIQVVNQFMKSKLDDYKDIGVRFYESFQNSLGTEAILQHYGFPTNLVDLTFSPLIALYFAGKSDKNTSQKRGNGVFLTLLLSNLELIHKRTPFTFNFSLLPPDHAPRLYQQQGFFLNCSHPDAPHSVHQVEDAFAHVYFPREYPDISGFEDVFSEELITKHMFFADSHPMRGKMLQTIEYEWYPMHFYYSELSKILLGYCQNNLTRFDKDEALNILEKEMLNNPIPRKTLRGASPMKESMELADSFSKSAEFLMDVSFQYLSQTRIAPRILNLYAEQNPKLLKAVLKSGKKFRAYNLDHYADELEQVDGLKQKLSKIPSDENMNYLKKMFPVSDSHGGSVMTFGE